MAALFCENSSTLYIPATPYKTFTPENKAWIYMVSVVLPSKPLFPSIFWRNPKKPPLRSPSSSSHSFVTRKMKFPQHVKNQTKREEASVAHRHPPVLDVILHIKVVDQKWLAQLGISNCLIQGES